MPGVTDAKMKTFQEITNAKTLERHVDMKKCLACGKPLYKNTMYCSQKCKSAKPYKMVQIEKEHDKPAKQVILEMLNRTDNIELTSGLLGISKPQLQRYIKILNLKRQWVG